jgi:hypothetical protein
MTGPAPEGLLALLVELDRLRAVLVDALEHMAPQPVPVPPADADAETQGLFELLLGARRAVFGNPAAARALQDMLVAEGRRYAQTPEGSELRDALATSDGVADLRRVWETVSLNVLDGPAPPEGIPAAWTEALCDAIAGRVVDDTALARLRPPGLA